MKRLFTLLTLCLPLLFCACVDEDEQSNTPQGNFEALWRIIDERYCFFDYKQHETGLNWQQVYNTYKPRIDKNMTSQQLFEVLADMLSQLRDGHVNLTSSHDMARYWSWYENYPTNYSDSLIRRYLGTNYRIAAGIDYRILDDNIGYIRYASFTEPIGEGNLDEALLHMALCQGLIIDIRNNGGGDLTNAEMLASRFVNEKTLVGYIQHKTGPGHNDFSDMQPFYIEPASGIRWHRPVCILTNRHVFSAANAFAAYMKTLPQVKLVGDHTGGGAGMPFSATLPNGWVVRFSAVPTYDAQRQSTEFGMDPHVFVSLTDTDFQQGIDPIIEKARKLLVE